MIKHKWKEIDVERYDVATHLCTVCGCKRHKMFVGGKYPFDFMYTRNGITFPEGRPDCYEDDSESFKHGMGYFN